MPSFGSGASYPHSPEKYQNEAPKKAEPRPGGATLADGAQTNVGSVIPTQYAPRKRDPDAALTAAWAARACPKATKAQLAAGAAAAGGHTDRRAPRLTADDQRQIDEQMRGGEARHQRTEAALQDYEKKDREQANTAEQDGKRFLAEYKRRMPLIQRLLDGPAIGKEAQAAHRNLVACLWGPRVTSAHDFAIQAYHRGETTSAKGFLDQAWTYGKELLNAQTKEDSQEDFLEEAKDALARSKEPLGNVVKAAGKVVQWAEAITSLSARLQTINDAARACGAPNLPDEIFAVSAYVEDCGKAGVFLGGLSASGVGAPVAAVLSVGIVTGLGLEGFSVLMDLLRLMEKSVPQVEPLKTILENKNTLKELKEFAGKLKEIERGEGEIVALAKKIRQFLHPK